jgi:hypothetical protein
LGFGWHSSFFFPVADPVPEWLRSKQEYLNMIDEFKEQVGPEFTAVAETWPEFQSGAKLPPVLADCASPEVAATVQALAALPGIHFHASLGECSMRGFCEYVCSSHCSVLPTYDASSLSIKTHEVYGRSYDWGRQRALDINDVFNTILNHVSAEVTPYRAKFQDLKSSPFLFELSSLKTRHDGSRTYIGDDFPERLGTRLFFFFFFFFSFFFFFLLKQKKPIYCLLIFACDVN